MEAFRHRGGSGSITVEKEGPLYVKRNFSFLKPKEKSWQLKYIVLRKSYGNPTYLEWYENFAAFTEHKNSQKLQLDGIDYIGHVDLGKEHHYAFVLFGEGQSKLQMAAKTEAERSEWINALNNCLQNSPTSPKINRSNCKSYPIELRDYHCLVNPDILRDSNKDYVLNIGTKCLDLVKIDARGESKIAVTWLLQNIKSYESRTVENNPGQKLLSIETGRRSQTGSGTFNFFTPHGDQIKSQISLNTKLTFVQKMNSQDLDGNGPYSCSPEANRTFSTSPHRVFNSTGGYRRATISSKEGPIPFDKYDPPSNHDGYGHYIEHSNGYIGVLTDQRQVEKNRDRVRSRSRSNPSTSRTPSFPDHPSYVRIPPESQEGYIDVLPDESHNQYIDVLPADETELSHHTYIDVVGEEKTSPPNDTSLQSGSALSEDHPAYIEVLGDEESNNQISINCTQNENPVLDEIYVDVDQNRRTYELFQERSHEQHLKSRGQNIETRVQHSKLHEQHSELSDAHVTETFCQSTEEQFESREENRQNHTLKCEQHVTHSSLSRNVQESGASVSSPSPRWPGSMTSQTSQEFSSFSSENDVFQEHEKNVVSEVFAEESANSEDIPRVALVDMSNSQKPSGNSENVPKDDSVKPKDYLTGPPLPPKTTLMASKSATLPTVSEGQATDNDVDMNGVGLVSGDRRSVKAGSWHGEDGYNSENSSSTSESRGSREISEDENSDPNELSRVEEVENSDIQHDSRNRSHTEGDADLLTTNVNIFNALTNPQSASCVIPRHPPLTREPMYTNARVISQLENPLQGMGEIPETKPNKIYICSNCGWHKRSKKRSSLRPSFKSNKNCPRCLTPVTKQDAKISKSKDKSSGGIFSKMRSKTKRRGSDEKDEKRDPNFMKPERPVDVPQPLFVKKIGGSNFAFTGRHTPVIDPKRCELGLAPSPLAAMSAIAIDRGDSRVNFSHDDSNSSGKTPLNSDEVSSKANDLPAPHRTASLTPLSKQTPMSSGSSPLGRTRSSPPFGGGGDDTCATQDTLPVDPLDGDRSPRLNSNMTLPTLPEDPPNFNQQIPGTPPPVIPPRPRAPPVPPRRGSSPLSIPRDNSSHKLRRTQTDPTFSLPPQVSPQLKAKNRISRTLTDPGKDASSSEENIRHAISLGSLLENEKGDSLQLKVASLSLDDGINSDAPPPPLPPRKGSSQTSPANPVLPRRTSNEGDRILNHIDSPRIPARMSNEARQPGSGSPKLPLTSKRSLEAKRADFMARKAVYNSHAGDD